MKMFHCFTLLATLQMCSSLGNREIGPCASPQYIEFSTTDTLLCHFERNAFAVLWYNSSDYSNSEPIFYYKQGQKSGDGYTSGEFDVDEHGSLIIRNVSLNHDHDFTVIKLSDSKDDLVPHKVLAIVTVMPKTNFPVITKCGAHSTACFTEVDKPENITCSIHGARPAVPLKWVVRTFEGDKNVTSYGNVYTDGDSFSTHTMVNNIFIGFSDVVLLVCKAAYPLPPFSLRESIIIAEYTFNRPRPQLPIVSMVKYKSEMKLTCLGGNATFLIWKKRIKSEEVPVAIFSRGRLVKESLLVGYRVDSESSLIAPLTDMKHDGTYTCLYGDSYAHSLVNYRVIIFVLPVPPHPTVDGCENHGYCTLERKSEGYLTCRMNGIRPQVQLEWKTFPIGLSSKITFAEHLREINHKGNLFDVSVTSKYRLNDLSQNRITVECRSSGLNASELNLAMKLDLFFLHGEDNMTTDITATDKNKFQYHHQKWIIPVALAGVILLLLFIVCKIVKGKSKKERKRQMTDKLETIPMFDNTVQTSRYSGKKEIFIEELKVKYGEICAALQPVPFIRDRLFGIEDIFVEGRIEFLCSSENKFGNEVWERLQSYKEIFTDSRIRSKRYILEGGPGYGKSTLALRMAHEWCNGIQTSLMPKFDVLILLKVRQLTARMSIAQATKRLLLPIDSALSEDEVQSILRSCSSGLIILDGYDEGFSHMDEMNNEIESIIKRELFQSFVVVLTTRPSAFPLSYAPQTKRLRLKGFDERARDTYITKVVVANNTESFNTVKDRLRENPVLNDLCQVPLFFVMFAHLTHEKQEFHSFLSVTTFFRYIISCIHGHMRQKLALTSEHVLHFDIDHSKLDKVAFDSAIGGCRHTRWTKDELREQIGNDCFETFVKLGILIIEKNLHFADSPGAQESEHVQYIEEVTFYHELFGEWYAAHHLSQFPADSTLEYVNERLKNVNPFQRQYLLRFACGLSPDTGGKLIQYLQRLGYSDEIIILCIIEQKENYSSILETVKDLCSRALEIRRNDSRMMQRATLQLLDIAHKNKVTTSCMRFWNCFNYPITVSRNLEIDSGLSLPNLRGIRNIEVYESGRKLNVNDVNLILKYLNTCEELNAVRFFDCLMPITFESTILNFKVLWYTESGEWYIFDGDFKMWKEYVPCENEAECNNFLSKEKFKEVEKLFNGKGEDEKD